MAADIGSVVLDLIDILELLVEGLPAFSVSFVLLAEDLILLRGAHRNHFRAGVQNAFQHGVR